MRREDSIRKSRPVLCFTVLSCVLAAAVGICISTLSISVCNGIVVVFFSSRFFFPLSLLLRASGRRVIFFFPSLL